MNNAILRLCAIGTILTVIWKLVTLGKGLSRGEAIAWVVVTGMWALYAFLLSFLRKPKS